MGLGSNAAPTTGLQMVYAYINYCGGDDPGQKINTHTAARSLSPSQWHRTEMEEQIKETCRSNKDSLTGEGKRGHTTPKPASDSKEVTHYLPQAWIPFTQQPP